MAVSHRLVGTPPLPSEVMAHLPPLRPADMPRLRLPSRRRAIHRWKTPPILLLALRWSPELGQWGAPRGSPFGPAVVAEDRFQG